MFKIGKVQELKKEEKEIFLTNCTTHYYDSNESKVSDEYKEINFIISSSIDEKTYSLSFMFKGPVEELLKLEKHTNYDIKDFLFVGESFLGINDEEYYEAAINGNILRFSNNKYIIDITFNNLDNEYFGHIEFDFILDDYINCK